VGDDASQSHGVSGARAQHDIACAYHDGHYVIFIPN
jgi:hypothetical protein